MSDKTITPGPWLAPCGYGVSRDPEGHRERSMSKTHHIDASQLQAPVHVAHGRIEELPDYDDEDTPMTRMEFGALLLLGVVSWSVVGALIYGAVKLAEVLR